MKVNLSPLTMLFFALYLLLHHDLTLAATLTAILIHELVHLVALHLCGGHATVLTLTPMGLSIERVGLLSHGEEVWVSLSAPLANLLLAILFSILKLDPCTIASNLSFGLLNLLPIYPLDGGKVISAFFGKFLTSSQNESICRKISFVVLLLFWMFSVAIALEGDGNLSPLLLSAGLFLANSGNELFHK